MPVTLRTLKATIQPDGAVRFSQPLELDEPTDAVVTFLVPSREPNETTLAAMREPKATLPHFATAQALFDELEN